jgi:hypothetical protein
MGDPTDSGQASLQRARAALDLRRQGEDAVAHAGRGQSPSARATPRPNGVLAQALLGLVAPRPRRLLRGGGGAQARRPGRVAPPPALRGALGAGPQGRRRWPAADAAVRLDPSSPWAHAARRARALAGARRPALKAIDEAKAALKLAPEEATLHAGLAELLLPSGRQRRAAAAHFKDSLALDPRQAGVLNDYAASRSTARREAGRHVAFRSAMLLDPTMKVRLRNVHGAVRPDSRGGPRSPVSGAATRPGRSCWSAARGVDPGAPRLPGDLTRRSLAADRRAAQLAERDPAS